MSEDSNYVKRTQGDYSLSLKLPIVQQIEQGKLSTTAAQRKYGIQARSTLVNWLRNYGSFDWENQTPSNMPKKPEQKIMELEAKVKLLEKQTKGKAKMREYGSVSIPQEAFIAALRLGEE